MHCYYCGKFSSEHYIDFSDDHEDNTIIEFNDTQETFVTCPVCGGVYKEGNETCDFY